MSRKYYSDVNGKLGSGGLTNSATTHTLTSLSGVGGSTVPTLAVGDHFLLSILDASDNVLEVVKVTAWDSGTKAITIVRGQEGTTGIAHAGSLDVSLSINPSDLQLGVLDSVSYGPGSNTTVATVSGTHAAIDASHLVTTFVAPPSGTVLVTLNAWASAGASTVLAWGLLDGATVVADMAVTQSVGRSTARIRKAGLSPGTSYTYTWAHRLWAGSASSGIVYQTGTNEAVMSVEAA